MANNGHYDSDSEVQDDIPVFEYLTSSQQTEDLCSKLILMHNRLIDVFGAVDSRDEEFNLPEIVVVGTQVLFNVKSFIG